MDLNGGDADPSITAEVFGRNEARVGREGRDEGGQQPPLHVSHSPVAEKVSRPIKIQALTTSKNNTYHS